MVNRKVVDRDASMPKMWSMVSIRGFYLDI